MDGSRIVVPVTLKGVNYLLWSRTTKTVLCSRGLWSHIEKGEAPQNKAPQGEIVAEGGEIVTEEQGKWFQEDQLVLSIIQNSLEASLLEAYSFCETSKELWDILQTVYGNTSNLSRVFEVKKSINELTQEDMEFTQHFGKFRSLWAELEMLRPSTIDPLVLNERREQDKVFGLLLTLNSSYNELIKHLLRSETLPSLDEVCNKIQKEQGSLGLFGGKGELIHANKAINKGSYGRGEKRGFCDHCKREGHSRDKCWILHPHLKPEWMNNPKIGNKTKWTNSPRANVSQELAIGAHRVSQEPATSAHKQESSFNGGEGAALAAHQHEFVKKADLDALIKALKDSNSSGTLCGNSFQALISPKPLVVDSGASHHMISDKKLINNLVLEFKD